KMLGKTVRFHERIVRKPLYLLDEMFGRLDEEHALVYLTDGGHIENLGLYQLLRRRCRLIVVVDAEADPAFGFPSLVRLERYARIDLGIRIKLPWQAIADGSTAVDAAIANDAMPVAEA